MDNLERTEEGSLLSLYSENGATKLLAGYDDDCCATSVTLDTLQRALNRYGLRIEGEISGDLPQSADDVFARYYPRLVRGEES